MNKTIAGFTIEDLIKQHRKNLFDDFLSFMDQYIVDHKKNTDIDYGILEETGK